MKKQHFKNHTKPNPNFSIFFQLLKTSVKKKVQKFTVPLFKNYLEILSSLCGAGLIKGFSLSIDKNITIYLRYDASGISTINNIVIAKPNNIRYLSQKDLKIMRNLSKVLWGLFRTQKGLKSLDYCCAQKLGGQFVAYII